MENDWHVDKKGEFTSYWRDEELTFSSPPYISIQCTEIASGKKHPIDADIIVETMYEIHINGIHTDSFLASPDHLKELAVGYLICEGHITILDDILSLKISDGTI